MRDLRIRESVIKERKKGNSFKKLALKFNLPEGTVYSWIKDVQLSAEAKAVLKKNSEYGRVLGRRTVLERRKREKLKLQRKTTSELSSLNVDRIQRKLLCAFLFWAEGAKELNHVTFINSDPKMVKTFLILFRSSFDLDERKFRILVHLHEYHEEKEILKYWSEVTGIPLNQFNRSYLKPHTGKNKHDGYRGCVSIRYYDYKIAQELFYLYNTFSDSLGV